MTDGLGRYNEILKTIAHIAHNYEQAVAPMVTVHLGIGDKHLNEVQLSSQKEFAP